MLEIGALENQSHPVLMDVAKSPDGRGYVAMGEHLPNGYRMLDALFFDNIDEAHTAVKEANRLWNEFMEMVNG